MRFRTSNYDLATVCPAIRKLAIIAILPILVQGLIFWAVSSTQDHTHRILATPICDGRKMPNLMQGSILAYLITVYSLQPIITSKRHRICSLTWAYLPRPVFRQPSKTLAVFRTKDLNYP